MSSMDASDGFAYSLISCAGNCISGAERRALRNTVTYVKEHVTEMSELLAHIIVSATLTAGDMAFVIEVCCYRRCGGDSSYHCSIVRCLHCLHSSSMSLLKQSGGNPASVIWG